MKEKSRKMALCGVLCALSTVCMLLGGIIPFATFCCPALAAALLTPLLFEVGDKMTLAAYAAVAVLMGSMTGWVVGSLIEGGRKRRK